MLDWFQASDFIMQDSKLINALSLREQMKKNQKGLVRKVSGLKTCFTMPITQKCSK